jgi:hypothetical protein
MDTVAEKYHSPGLGVIVVLDNQRGLQNPTLQKVLQAIPKIRILMMDNPHYLKELHRLMLLVMKENHSFWWSTIAEKDYMLSVTITLEWDKHLLNIIDEDSSMRESEKKPSGNIK